MALTVTVPGSAAGSAISISATAALNTPLASQIASTINTAQKAGILVTNDFNGLLPPLAEGKIGQIADTVPGSWADFAPSYTYMTVGDGVNATVRAAAGT